MGVQACCPHHAYAIPPSSSGKSSMSVAGEVANDGVEWVQAFAGPLLPRSLQPLKIEMVIFLVHHRVSTYKNPAANHIEIHNIIVYCLNMTFHVKYVKFHEIPSHNLS